MAMIAHLGDHDAKMYQMSLGFLQNGQDLNFPPAPIPFNVMPTPTNLPIHNEAISDPTYFFVQSPITPGCQGSQMTNAVAYCDNMSSFGDSDEADNEGGVEVTEELLRQFKQVIHEGDRASIIDGMSGFKVG